MAERSHSHRRRLSLRYPCWYDRTAAERGHCRCQRLTLSPQIFFSLPRPLLITPGPVSCVPSLENSLCFFHTSLNSCPPSSSYQWTTETGSIDPVFSKIAAFLHASPPLVCHGVQISRLKKRQCVHSCTQLVTYTGRTYLHLGTKGPQHFNSVLRSTAASTLSDVLVHAADLTGLMATVRRGSFKRTDHNGAAAREYSSAKFDVRKKTRIHARRVCQNTQLALPRTDSSIVSTTS